MIAPSSPAPTLPSTGIAAPDTSFASSNPQTPGKLKRLLHHLWNDVLKNGWPLLRDTFSSAGEDKVPRMGAALAYYTIFSVAPLLMLVLAMATIYEGQKAAHGQLSAELTHMMGAPTADAIQSMVVAASRKRADKIITIVSIVILFIGASGVFVELQDSLNTIWEVTPKPNRGIWSVLKDRFLSFSMVFAIGFLLLVSLVISAALSTVDHAFMPKNLFFQVIWIAISILISLGVISVMFAAMFKFLPDVRIHWRDVWIGAVATAILFTVGKWAISQYIGKAGVANSYGATGSLVVLLLWVYYSAQIFLIGAEFTRVYANRFGSRVLPDDNAIGVTREARAQQGLIGQDGVNRDAAVLRHREHLVQLAREMQDQAERRQTTDDLSHLTRLIPAVLAFAAGLAWGRFSKNHRPKPARAACPKAPWWKFQRR